LVDRDSICRLLSCVHDVRLLHRVLRGKLSEIAGAEGVSDTDLLTLLSCVDSDEGIYQRDLADRIGVSTGQMSAVVDRLKRCEFLIDQRPVEDRRRVHWKVTALGMKLVDRLSGCLELLISSIAALDSTGPMQLDQIRQTLEKLPRPLIEPVIQQERKRA
jgi:DNA-binding MarR family transcriptional regulator